MISYNYFVFIEVKYDSNRTLLNVGTTKKWLNDYAAGFTSVGFLACFCSLLLLVFL